MTREERTELIRHLKYNRSIGADYLITDKDADEIIKALEQEPCEDAISRQSVLDMMQMRMSGKELYKAVYNLSSVTPTPKWIPCSERPPKKGQQVLVTQIVRGETIVYGTVFPFEKTREKYITAWMPKPKPYQPEMESEE